MILVCKYPSVEMSDSEVNWKFLFMGKTQSGFNALTVAIYGAISRLQWGTEGKLAWRVIFIFWLTIGCASPIVNLIIGITNFCFHLGGNVYNYLLSVADFGTKPMTLASYHRVVTTVCEGYAPQLPEGF
ncbi:hypothetical protein B0H67DRAFT_569057 [Lasiosphaeris hirsuta]|uniref:Uncharacterized protein n=1 Tax=Lasiosphaeris hirsuta TaxID=260670 RepID=A0AA40AZI8_9PEZI|nr:hypothetical protein B0H67DRAFT_569057 [Lasiosphaeris hirsuta]